jgi:molybdate transport system substrate-binding protein
MNAKGHAARLLALSLLVVASCKRPNGSDETAPSIKVAAASDLQTAFPEVADAFEKATKTKVIFSFGSSGLLAKQIQEGAPFDVFAAANVAFVDDAIKTGACQASTKVEYARGRIVMWWKADAGIAPPKSITDLADERFHKIAIANPEHAPYGKAAEEALMKSGIYDKVKPKLVFGENIQQTFQFARSGNVEAAIVSLSLALDAKGGDHLAIDEALHGPIVQAIAACGDRPTAEMGRRFVAFVTSNEGRVIMKRHGFLLPGENIATTP